MPHSKRHAETEDEYKIILSRQNEIITELFGNRKAIILLFGQYDYNLIHNNQFEINEFGRFEKVETLNLHQLFPNEYEDETYYTIFIKNDLWQAGTKNNILKSIADDRIRMLFICAESERIIYPYDGGIDMILESVEKRNFYKEKYKAWLPTHPKGL